MESLGMVVFLVGALLAVVGGLGLVIAAFSESILWGLGVLFLSGFGVGLFFILFHWDRSKGPFFLSLLGGVMAGIGSAMIH